LQTNFGAACLKRGEESTNFLFALFAILFSYTIFEQLFNILGTQNKNYKRNWPFLVKDMDFLSFYS